MIEEVIIFPFPCYSPESNPGHWTGANVLAAEPKLVSAVLAGVDSVAQYESSGQLEVWFHWECSIFMMHSTEVPAILEWLYCFMPYAFYLLVVLSLCLWIRNLFL